MSDEERRKIQIEVGQLSGNYTILEKGWSSKGVAKSTIPRLPALDSRHFNSTSGGLGSASTNDSVGYHSTNSASTARTNNTSPGNYYSPSRKYVVPQTARSAGPESATKRSQDHASKRQKQLEAKRRRNEEQIDRYLSNKKAAKLVKKQAATKIQSSWRGKKARTEVQHMREEQQAEQQAATTIQTSFRRFKAKREKERLQKEKAKAMNKASAGYQSMSASVNKKDMSASTNKKDMSASTNKKDMSASTNKKSMSASVNNKNMASTNGRGSSPDLDDDGEEPLSPEEIASLTKQFKLVDADNSGSVDRLEFGVFYNLIAKTRTSRRECDELFDHLDGDGSGSLSLSEFLRVYKILLNRERLKSDPREAERLRKMNEKFAVKAKMISENRSEMRRAKEQIEKDNATRDEANQGAVNKAKTDSKAAAKQHEKDEKKRLAEIQAEKDREARLQELASQKKEIELFVHKAEVKAIRLESEGAMDGETLVDEFTPEETEMLRKQFQKVDTDNSGFIDRDEFAVFYNRVSIEQVSHMEGVNLFKSLDVDGSGSLTFDEFVSVYNLLQQRERVRKDPTATERLRKMDEKLANKASLIAQSRKDDKQNRMEASVVRLNQGQQNKAMHNDVLAKRNATKEVTSPKAAPKKSQFTRKSVTGK